MENQKISPIDGGEVGTNRLEALTDGIFAIAMTLQVLGIHIPDLSNGDFKNGLLGILPHLFGFVNFLY